MRKVYPPAGERLEVRPEPRRAAHFLEELCARLGNDAVGRLRRAHHPQQTENLAAMDVMDVVRCGDTTEATWVSLERVAAAAVVVVVVVVVVVGRARKPEQRRV